jgi:hypothetical protein
MVVGVIASVCAEFARELSNMPTRWGAVKPLATCILADTDRH